MWCLGSFYFNLYTPLQDEIAEPRSAINIVRSKYMPTKTIIDEKAKRLPIRFLMDSLFHIQPGFKDLAISNTLNGLI
jgi:hypothetical protein